MTTPTTRPNVLIICAAIAVILFSAVGVAKMMDWLPTSNAVDAIAESETSATPEAAAQREDHAKNTEKVAASAQKETCASCGVLTEITPITQAAAPSGLGAVAGAVVGGAYAGNAIESKSRTTTSYRVRVRFEDGRRDSFSYAQAPNLSVGTAVGVRNGELVVR